jgi:predicted nucleic acid-binding protein
LTLVSCDTNILLHAINNNSPYHKSARQLLAKWSNSKSFRICELVLLELYGGALTARYDPDEALLYSKVKQSHTLLGFSCTRRNGYQGRREFRFQAPLRPEHTAR